MNLDYVSKIKFGLKRYKTIATDKTTSRVLDGSYNSIYKGRSMNFDELREYVPGDDIKDIDWKATSRSQKVLIRSYIAEKKHNIMLVMDANRRMLADTKAGEEKGEVALMAGGTLGYMVTDNGDYVSGLYYNEEKMERSPFKTGFLNLEFLLEGYAKCLTPTNKSDLNGILTYIMHNIKRRMIVVTDYIKNNLTADDLSQAAMAEMAGISKDYFSRIFKNVTGMNYSKWLNTVRLEKATELLSQNDMTLTEVAMLSGFQSIPSFNRVFRTEKGMTPGEYRNLFAK